MQTKCKKTKQKELMYPTELAEHKKFEVVRIRALTKKKKVAKKKTGATVSDIILETLNPSKTCIVKHLIK